MPDYLIQQLESSLDANSLQTEVAIRIHLDVYPDFSTHPKLPTPNSLILCLFANNKDNKSGAYLGSEWLLPICPRISGQRLVDLLTVCHINPPTLSEQICVL